MEVLNVLETKVYELSDKEKVPVIKMAGLRGFAVKKHFYSGRKKIQDCKGSIHSIM